MVRCTSCGIWACSTGELDKLPTQEYCPMHTHKDIFSKVRDLYNDPEIREISQTAAKIEATGYCKWSRLEETMEFAHQLNAQKIGIAFCLGLKREATTLANILKENGFQVASVSCKCGSIPKEKIGLRDDEKIHPGKYESICNPIGQAEVLNIEGTHLNLIVGLCVGHDSLFIKHSKALVTCLVAKDRVLAHNPVGALYTSQSYYRKKLHKRIE